MPRERIQHGKLWADLPGITMSDGDGKGVDVPASRTPYLPDVQYPGAVNVTEDPSLDVTWHSGSVGDGSVQVSIDLPREIWLKTARELEKTPDQIKQAVFTDAMSRSEINHMIRVLRRARDQAHGKDE
jgi:hypothetical protein